MSITLYGIPNCDSIKKTKRWLDQNGIEYTFHDYKKSGLSAELAQRFLQEFGHDAVNKRGTTWRKLPEQLRESNDTEHLARLMQESPSLAKRPIIHQSGNAGDCWLIGFNEDQLGRLKQ
jgi:Spx/MgsR family transcriptional regulator